MNLRFFYFPLRNNTVVLLQIIKIYGMPYPSVKSRTQSFREFLQEIRQEDGILFTSLPKVSLPDKHTPTY